MKKLLLTILIVRFHGSETYVNMNIELNAISFSTFDEIKKEIKSRDGNISNVIIINCYELPNN